MAFRDYLQWLPFVGRPQTPINLSNPVGLGTRGVSHEEMGVSGTENFGGTIRNEDANPEFDDWVKAVKLYDKMRRIDPQVRAMLQVIKLPLRGATWECQPASSDPIDRMISDFCNEVLFNDTSLTDSWDYVLRHILLQMDYGFSVLEKSWTVDDAGYYRFKRLAPRLPKTIREWHVDNHGQLEAVVQYAPVQHGNRGRTSIGVSGRPNYSNSVSYKYVTIPAQYAAVFSLEREGDNYQGQSLLRSVWRNYTLKDQAYLSMAVGIDRWGVGIPVAQLEEGHGLSEDDKVLLRDILKRVRSNERAYIVMPEHTKFSIEPSGSAQGTLGSFGISWIEHHDSQIARNVLANFLTMGQDKHGTLGFGSRLTDMFVSSLNGVAAGIIGELKSQVIKPLCNFNFDMTRRKYPEPVALDLEQLDLDALVDVLTKLSGVVITAQDDDEVLIRKQLGLPKLREELSRKARMKEKDVPLKSGVATPKTGEGQEQPAAKPHPQMGLPLS